MAALIGKDGLISATSSTAGTTTAMTPIDSWSVNPSVATAELTAFGDSWESHDATIKAWAATCAGTLDRANASQAKLLDQLEDATLGNMYFRFYISSSTGGDKYWTGGGIIENWSIDSAVKDRVGISYSAKGDGALTYTTTTS